MAKDKYSAPKAPKTEAKKPESVKSTPDTFTEPRPEPSQPKITKPAVKSLLEWIDKKQIAMRTPLPQPNSYEAGEARMLSVMKGKVQELE